MVWPRARLERWPSVPGHSSWVQSHENRTGCPTIIITARIFSLFAFPGFSLQKPFCQPLGSSNLAPFMAIIAMRKEQPNAQCECGGTEEPAEQVSYIRQSRRRSGDPRP